MVGELEVEEGKTVKRLSDFLPPDLRMEVFRTVEEHSKDENTFERTFGISLQDIKEADVLDRYFPRILAFALANFSEVREVIRSDLLEEIGSLCENIGIVEGKIAGRKRNNFERFMEDIDGKSREIIWYLLSNRYAGIRELSDLTHETDMGILTKVREVINPAAKKFLGKEIMEFKESRMDESIGKKITFKWWIREDFPFLVVKREEMLDVFDESDQIRIVAELPHAVEENDIRIEVNDDIVRIIAKAPDGRYERRVPLFYAVEDEVKKTYKNRILGIRLIKKEGKRG